jgi:hypothetical protein
MRGLVIAAVLALAVPSVWARPSSSDAPSLGELAERAKKEREARRAGKPAPRVLTEADLKSHSWGAPASAEAESETATPAADKGATPAKTEEQLRAEKRQEIEKKIAEQVQTAAVVRKAMDDAQRELNDPSTVSMFGSRGAALQKLLDDGQAELKKTEQAIADLEEEARRQGIPISRP